jgi:hypothetical protein
MRDQGNTIDLEIARSGTIKVTNSRDQFSKTYKARAQ